MEMPRLFDVFDYPKTKSVRAVTSLRQKIDVEEVWNRLEKAKKIRTSKKEVAKFEVGKGHYLLLFPSGYIQIYAPSEEQIREVLKVFRDALYEKGLFD